MKIKKIKTLLNEEDRQQILWETEDIRKYESFDETFVTKFIVSSAVFVENFFTGEKVVPETFLFPANENGQIISFLELRGSLNRVFDHEKAIENVGFTIVESF
jgi:predicted acetyltransferase